ncbi:metalloregulator ArsR/SmtB family transcription factor [Halalkaliarchaeum sp. AArc-GB]|uniref:ArsR/SmtB family transcription factor n=1 Tax=unclassified Halalkaliarchaeum TaxID=2678344 RepID=UPI00217E9B8B|nr:MULTISPECIES: metalloregulator ArsR/SmtB family transcription factor [unclassified Halalkaliarchaeum]MDR5673130.1 metalloregulator ArsR/SmtB family transcription factor [Halalkaliarchaeum sp. AArc-GB]
MSGNERTESVSHTLGRLGECGCGDESLLDARRTDGETTADQLSVFKALANENRIRILEALRDGELCACELEEVLDAPQSTVASHLSTLRDAGLVYTRKEGKWTHYRIADTASLQLLDLAAAMGGNDEETERDE